MKKENIGILTILISAILLIAYGLYKGFQSMREFDVIAGILFLIFFIGIVYLIIVVYKQQKNDIQKKKKEIKKEDLEP
ncbi:MAG: hypothetical protein JSW73_03570 [Candidatus Woesearchaeota archaeon]|nr:MAG: hypothetical protein JSW73_03570 [Candidatus Woesearchaeota archaeon]